MYTSSFPIEDIIAELDLSVADFANFIELSKTHTYRVVQRKSDLDGIHLLRLSQLGVMVKTSRPDPTANAKRLKQENEALKKKLTARNKELLIEILATETKLAEMVTNYTKIVRIINIYNGMDTKFVKLEEKGKLWIQQMVIYWEARLANFDATHQHTLKTKLLLLKQEQANNAKVMAKM